MTKEFRGKKKNTKEIELKAGSFVCKKHCFGRKREKIDYEQKKQNCIEEERRNQHNGASERKRQQKDMTLMKRKEKQRAKRTRAETKACGATVTARERFKGKQNDKRI